MTPASFRTIIWAHYKKYGRHDLPWRNTRDPYRILVSEVMLQQTQVERVIPFYKDFLKKFPTVKVLAKASLSEVLMAWQGLGYNRRAKMLHQTAREVVENCGGTFPKTAEELETLPGIGPYTARAVAAFAHNSNGIFIETNIRTAITHHFFSGKRTTTYGGTRSKVGDAQIEEVLRKVFPKGRAREWYAALMDYGSYLKRSGVRLNVRHAGYMKQKPFRGSDREARGAILRALVIDAHHREQILAGVLGEGRRAQVQKVLKQLCTEGLVEKQGTLYRLPQ